MLRVSDRRLITQSASSLIIILSLAALAYWLAQPRHPLVLGLFTLYNP